MKKLFFRNFAKFTGKHLCQNLFFNKVAGLPASLLKKRLWNRCFPVNFSTFLRTPLLTKHPWWLLLTTWKKRPLNALESLLLTLQLTFFPVSLLLDFYALFVFIFYTVKPLNSRHLRVLKNLSIIERCPVFGGNLKKIVTFGTERFVRYSWHVRYLGCPLLGGFTVFLIIPEHEIHL